MYNIRMLFERIAFFNVVQRYTVYFTKIIEVISNWLKERETDLDVNWSKEETKENTNEPVIAKVEIDTKWEVWWILSIHSNSSDAELLKQLITEIDSLFNLMLDKLENSINWDELELDIENSCWAQRFEELKQNIVAIDNFLIARVYSDFLDIAKQILMSNKKIIMSKESSKEDFQRVMQWIILEFWSLMWKIGSLIKTIWFEATDSFLDEELLKESPVVEFSWGIDENWPVDRVTLNVEKLTWYNIQEFYSWCIMFKWLIDSRDIERVSKEIWDYMRDWVTSFEQKYRIITKSWETKFIYNKMIAELDENWEYKKLHWFIYDITDQYISEYWIPNELSMTNDIESSNWDINVTLLKLNSMLEIESIYWNEIANSVVKQASERFKWIFNNIAWINLYQISNKIFWLVVESNPNFDPIWFVDFMWKIINWIEINVEWWKIHLNISCWNYFFSHKADDYMRKAKIALSLSQLYWWPKIFTDWLWAELMKENKDFIEWSRKILEWLNHKRFVLFYQWIRNNKTWEIDKHEALVRYRWLDWKYKSPFFFLKYTKKIWKINELTKVLFMQVTNKMKEVDGNIWFTFNLTMQDLKENALVKWLISDYKNSWLDFWRLTFEIVEDNMEEKEEQQVLQNISLLKKVWFKIAVDDFWAWSSNFERVLKIAPDFIKIDWTFVKNLVNDKKSRTIVKLIIWLAEEIWAKTVAEYVETEETQELLDSYWIDYSQWFLYSKPDLDIDQVTL